MIIILDGQNLDAAAIAGGNLEEILGDIQHRYLGQDRVVSEVTVNGKPYSEDLPHAAVEIQREAVENLELKTISSLEIARHFIEHGAAQLELINRSLPRITEMFRLGDETEANEHFLRFLEALHLLISMMEYSGQALGVAFGSQTEDLGTMQKRFENLAGILTQLLKIQEQSDWVYLSDVLEYELAPELEAIAEMLPLLKGTKD